MMIDRLWTIRGRTLLGASATPSAVMTRLCGELDLQRILYNIAPDHGALSWELPWRQLIRNNWNLLAGFDAGMIAIEGPALIYRLDMKHSLLLALFASLSVVGFASSDFTLLRGSLTGAAVFLWLYGANWIMMTVQTARFFRKIAEDV